MKKRITTAIIPVAGYGTRRLPVAKALEKCMLPVANRPVVDYVVQDCIAAGIREIWFVVGEESRQIRQYYGRNKKLEKYLKLRGKSEFIDQILPPEDVNFHFLVQSGDGKYGTAIPLAMTLAKIGTKNPVLYVMGDAFFYKPHGGSEFANLIAAVQNADEGTDLAIAMPENELENYGVLDVSPDGILREIVEKPARGAAPSNLINSANYVLPPKLLEMTLDFVNINDFPPDKEYYATDVATEFAKTGGVMRVVPSTGEFLDGGNLAGWVHANNVVAGDLLK